MVVIMKKGESKKSTLSSKEVDDIYACLHDLNDRLLSVAEILGQEIQNISNRPINNNDKNAVQARAYAISLAEKLKHILIGERQ